VQKIPANRSFFDRFPSLVAVDAGGRHLVSRLWIKALGPDPAWIAKRPDLKLASGGKVRQGFLWERVLLCGTLTMISTSVECHALQHAPENYLPRERFAA
jgi:hypothetical protein